MRNPALLSFLAAVQSHCETATTLMRATGLEPLELQHAVAVAEELGLVEATGAVHPSLCLTADGWSWVRHELAPFRCLMSNAKLVGGVS